MAASLGSAQDLLRFAMTCKRAAAVAEDQQLWRKLCERFNVPCSARVPSSWRALYQFNHDVLYNHIFGRRSGGALRQQPSFPVLGRGLVVL